MRFCGLLKNFVLTARNRGPVSALAALVGRARLRFRERSFGIHTEDSIKSSALAFDNPDFKQYWPTDYNDFKVIMNQLAIDPSKHVFFDYGAGMGRAMVLA